MRSLQNKRLYIFIGLFSTLAVFLFAVWLPSFSLLRHVAISSDFPAFAKLNIIIATLGTFKTIFPIISQITLVVISILFGINISILTYYLKQKHELDKSMGLGIAGTLLGLIGIGCVSCGSVILTAFFGLTATAGFIGTLPLHGQEFGIFGIVILSTSIFLVFKKIKEPVVCK